MASRSVTVSAYRAGSAARAISPDAVDSAAIRPTATAPIERCPKGLVYAAVHPDQRQLPRVRRAATAPSPSPVRSKALPSKKLRVYRPYNASAQRSKAARRGCGSDTVIPEIASTQEFDPHFPRGRLSATLLPAKARNAPRIRAASSLLNFIGPCPCAFTSAKPHSLCITPEPEWPRPSRCPIS